MAPDSNRSESSREPVVDPLIADLAAATQLRNLATLRRGLEHELRSPLNAIVLNVELLKELTRAGAAESEVVRLERLDLIGKAVDRLQAGLSEFMDMVERPDPTSAVFDMGELIVDVQSAVRAELRQRGVALEVETESEPMLVSGRRGLLGLAVTNVLINALEASPRDRRVGLAGRIESGEVHVEIRDAGTGIDPDLQPRIFDLHFSSKTGSAGIGLYVARKLIEADGGRLELASTGANGTVFIARFPEVKV